MNLCRVQGVFHTLIIPLIESVVKSGNHLLLCHMAFLVYFTLQYFAPSEHKCNIFPVLLKCQVFTEKGSTCYNSA